MSVEPQALERSVLERKERDELATIAEAMGVKAGPRTSKANLIGQILREAGIETGDDDKPKRTTKSKAENGAANGEADEAAVATGDQPSEPQSEQATEAPAEQSPSEEDEDDSDIGAQQVVERLPGGVGRQEVLAQLL